MFDPNTILTTKQKNICEYGAGFGVLITLACLIQHFIVVIPSAASNPLVFGYIFSIIAFLLLGFQLWFSIWLLIISGAVSIVIAYIWISHYSLSLIVVMLFVYHVVIIVLSFLEEVPKKLKLKRAAAKAEDDMWAGKI